jgi:hypothetical protein
MALGRGFWWTFGPIWVLMLTALFALILFYPTRTVRAERDGTRIDVPGLHYDLHVIERPATCVYVYTNDSGVGMAAVPKTAQGC